jgi:hypothetical protein
VIWPWNENEEKAMATRQRKKAARTRRTVRAAKAADHDKAKVRRNRKLEIRREDGLGFQFLGSDGSNFVIIDPQGGITIGKH